MEMRHTCQGHACVCRKKQRKRGAKSETETGTSRGETNVEQGSWKRNGETESEIRKKKRR